MKKVVACIIARTNSTRLPQKVLRSVGKYILIEYLILKIKKSLLVDEIYICTSVNEDDKVLLDIAKKLNIKFYAGSYDSVIDRMLDVAALEQATEVVRITGDNLFTDEIYLDIMIEQHLNNEVDYTRTEYLPIGITAEVINVGALRKCYELMDPKESQYLLLYMFQPNIFNCLVILPEEKHMRPNYTLTVDTPDDYERTLKIIRNDCLLDLDEILAICSSNDIPNLLYQEIGTVKLPSNLTIFFETYRREIDLRIQLSKIYKLSTGEYERRKGLRATQNNNSNL